MGVGPTNQPTNQPKTTNTQQQTEQNRYKTTKQTNIKPSHHNNPPARRFFEAFQSFTVQSSARHVGFRDMCVLAATFPPGNKNWNTPNQTALAWLTLEGEQQSIILQLSGDVPLNHNKRECKMFPNNNHPLCLPLTKGTGNEKKGMPPGIFPSM